MATIYKKKDDQGNPSKNYFAAFSDGEKRIVKSTRTSRKKDAQRLADQWEDEARAIRENPKAAKRAAARGEGITSQIDKFKKSILGRGSGDRHATETARYVERVADAAGWATAIDCDAADLSEYVEGLASAKKSERTRQAVIVALRSFGEWLVQTHIHESNPFEVVKRGGATRVRTRRPLSQEEWAVLSHHIEDAGRRLLYRTAIETGYRKEELQSVQRLHLQLGDKPAHISLPGRLTKNGKDARQFISPPLAVELREFVGSMKPNQPVFHIHEKAADRLRKDLGHARALWIEEAKGKERKKRQESDFLTFKNHEGNRLDFHALRYTCGFWLLRNGAHLKTVQAIMRHSTITLTLDTYGHMLPSDESDAVLAAFSGIEV